MDRGTDYYKDLSLFTFCSAYDKIKINKRSISILLRVREKEMCIHGRSYGI